MKVRMSEDARAYLRDEAKYLWKRSPSAAKALTDAIRKARENLANFVKLGFVKEALPMPKISFTSSPFGTDVRCRQT